LGIRVAAMSVRHDLVEGRLGKRVNLRVAELETHFLSRAFRARAVADASIGPDRSKPSTEPPGATIG
jgi:hypothetical protein